MEENNNIPNAPENDVPENDVPENDVPENDVPENDVPGTAPAKEKPSKKKLIIIGVAAVVIIAAIILVVNLLSGPSFESLVSDMLDKYPYANNARASDDSYLKLDTNPYDKDIDDMTYAQLYTYSDLYNDTIEGIKYINERLGFSSALFEKMKTTTALMGRQTDENDNYRVSWTYHPTRGLEVTYEKK